MLAKDRFLKKIKLKIYIKIFWIFLFSSNLNAQSDYSLILLEQINSLDSFSASFIQSDKLSIEEGKIYIGKKRIKMEYLVPKKITIILDENKGMYVNHSLKEVEYFNPKNSYVGTFLKIFKDINFFDNAKYTDKVKVIEVEKTDYIENEKYELTIFLEKNPYILRKILLKMEDVYFTIGFSNHEFDINFNKKFFSFVNPFIIN